MRESPDSPLLREASGSRAEVARKRLKFITTFYVAIKNSRIFAADNEAAVQSIENLLTSIREVIEVDGMLALKVVYNYLVMNDRRARADIAMMECYSFILAELKRIKVNSISFESGVAADDLKKFIYILGAFKVTTQDAFQEFSSQLASAGVRGVTVAPVAAAGEEGVERDLQKRSTDAYVQSISVAREVLTKARGGRAVNFKQAKRVVQNIVDVAMEEDYFLLSLAAIKNYDEYTFNHSANVCVMSVGFGQKLGLSKIALEALGMGALLHDIGKIMIPLKVLNKPGELTDDEWTLMRRHPAMGVKSLLKHHVASDLLLHAILIAFEHHRQADMSGYPQVKEKSEQNLLSKIVQIADCYDALTTPRIYRRVALRPPEAFRTMLGYSGKSFDPDLLMLFIATAGLYPLGSLVKLDTGEIGLVYSVNQQPRYVDRPLVKVISDPSGKLAMNIIDMTEIDESTGKFTRTIVDCFTPSEYFEDMDDYLNML